MPTLEEILPLLIAYKYWLLFPIVFIEGPIITVIAGWLASMDYLDLWFAYGVIVIADIAGDTLYYLLGYWGRTKWINKYGHYIGISASRILAIEKLFKKHGGKTLIITKLSHAVGMPFLLAAGMSHMQYRKFLLYCFVATIPKSLFFILLGYYSGSTYRTIDAYLEYGTIAVILLIITTALIAWVGGKIADRYLTTVD